jgi:hypothetical protein
VGHATASDAGTYPSQADERKARVQANQAWLIKAFDLARATDAPGIVLMFQADMWDATSALSGFDDVVKQIGNLATGFGKPVLILEGDSHVFRVDQPYTSASPLFALHPGTPVAPNVTRLVVEASAGRTEYVRLTVDPKGVSLFSWERVPLHP